MLVVISTTNKAKIDGVKMAFTEYFNDCKYIEEKFDSNIREQPLSEIEGITGAINRAKNAFKKYKNADYCIGLEGYVDTNEFGMFIAGAAAIIDKNDNIGIGISGKMQIPDFIAKRLNNGEELGPLIQELMGDDENLIRHSEGTMGILSKGKLKRVEEFKEATLCALGRFVSPELYNK